MHTCTVAFPLAISSVSLDVCLSVYTLVLCYSGHIVGSTYSFGPECYVLLLLFITEEGQADRHAYIRSHKQTTDLSRVFGRPWYTFQRKRVPCYQVQNARRVINRSHLFPQVISTCNGSMYNSQRRITYDKYTLCTDHVPLKHPFQK